MKANTMKHILVASLFTLLGCTHPQEVKSTPLSGEGKPAAPVELNAEVTPTHARLNVRFEAAADQATITVSAIDGLTLTLAPEASPHPYKQGEVAQLDVDYLGDSGTLVVNVSGTFNGAPQSRVMTFAVGEVKKIEGGTKVKPDNGPGFKATPSGK